LTMSVVGDRVMTYPPERTKMNTSIDNIDNYTETFASLIEYATYGDIEKAALWYADAERVALEVARNLDASLEVGASVVSAFSPRERWSSNVTKAIAFSLGEKVTGLSNNLKMANASVHLGFDALKGPKTNAFARAIAGDTEAVVIDVWMMRAARMEVDSPNKTQYTELSQAIKRVARMNEMTPRTVQALIWIIVRGSAG
jgi:hypothetical protein